MFMCSTTVEALSSIVEMTTVLISVILLHCGELKECGDLEFVYWVPAMATTAVPDSFTMNTAQALVHPPNRC